MSERASSLFTDQPTPKEVTMTRKQRKLLGIEPDSTMGRYLKERRKRMSPWPAVCFWLLALCLWALWARDVLQG